MSLPQPPQPPQRTQTTCFRHPDREAGRRCTRCGRPACNECLVQATVGSHCVECARATRPSTTTRVRYWNASQPALVTMTLMAINVAVFVWMAIADATNLQPSRGITREQALLSVTEVRGIRLSNGDVYWLDLAGGEWYRLVSSGFLHFGIIHIAFNMFLLFQLGRLLEPAVGRVRFALMYFAALFGGSAGALILQPDGVHGGASGAVFGLMAAAAIGLRQRGINPFSTGIGPLLLINLFITFTIPGISIGGHLGGIVGGGLSAAVVMAPAWRFPKWTTYAAPAAIGVAAIIASVIAVQMSA